MTDSDSTVSSAAGGRPRSFDEDEVFEKLTRLFWQKGYSQTSIADIMEATGLHKPSLYRTFGTKEEMFTRVLRDFSAQQIANFRMVIDETGPGVEGVHAFLDMFTAETMPEATRQDGCLVVAASSELHGTIPGFADFAQHYRSQILSIMRTLVAKVDDDPDLVEQRAGLFTTFFLGHLLIARSGATDSELAQSIAAMRATVDSW